METNGNHGPGHRGHTVRGGVWRLCLAMVMASGATGCGPTPAVHSSASSLGLLAIPACSHGECDAPKGEPKPPEELVCDKGDCDSSSGNGNGLYVIEEGNYCFLFDGIQRFCPEAFVNTYSKYDQRDEVWIQLRADQGYIRPSRLDASYDGDQVEILGLRGEKTRLTIRYRLAGDTSDRFATTNEELIHFIFKFVVDVGKESYRTYQFVLTLKEDATGDSNKQYHLRYFNPYTQKWLWHCQSDKEQSGSDANDSSPPSASFLSGELVDVHNGYATRDPNALTLACQTGAIATCLSWGYTPWSPETGQFDDNRDYVYRSCLQAKRAAYFVGRGVGNGYTTTGTPILLRDQYGIRQDEISRDDLEAIWSPQGVVCINPDKLRHPEYSDKVSTHATGFNIPRCEPAEWSETGKLATGHEGVKAAMSRSAR